MSTNKTPEYESSSIKTLSSVAAIRRQAHTYLSDELHAVREILSNSSDEAQVGHGNLITVDVDLKTRRVTITDNGRGIPGKITKEHGGVSPLLKIFTEKDTGGKFDTESYFISGGTFGVGCTAVFALSKSIQVESRRKDGIYRLEGSDGKVTSFRTAKGVSKTGTTVSYILDHTLFQSEFGPISEFLKQLWQYLTIVTQTIPGLKILARTVDGNKIVETIKFEVDSSSSKSAQLKRLFEFFERDVSAPIQSYEVSLAKHDFGYFGMKCHFSENFKNTSGTICYINGSIRCMGGTPFYGLKQGILDAVECYVKSLSVIMQNRWKAITQSKLDICDNLDFILLVQISEPKFGGLTKARLMNNVVATLVRREISGFLKDLFKKPAFLTGFISGLYGKLPSENTGSKAKIKKLSSTDLLKLKNCSPGIPFEKRQLWLIEGDSGAGYPKEVAEPHQAVFPVGGVIENCGYSETVGADLAVIISIAKQHKQIVLFTDADPDGNHILVLLLAMLRKHCPDQEIFVPKTPLYLLKDNSGNVIHHVTCLEDAIAWKKDNRKQVHLDQVKGIGKLSMELISEIMRTPLIPIRNLEGGDRALSFLFSNPKPGTLSGKKKILADDFKIQRKDR